MRTKIENLMGMKKGGKHRCFLHILKSIVCIHYGAFLLIFTTFPDVKHKFENKAVHFTSLYNLYTLKAASN